MKFKNKFFPAWRKSRQKCFSLHDSNFELNDLNGKHKKWRKKNQNKLNELIGTEKKRWKNKKTKELNSGTCDSVAFEGGMRRVRQFGFIQAMLMAWWKVTTVLRVILLSRFFSSSALGSGYLQPGEKRTTKGRRWSSTSELTDRAQKYCKRIFVCFSFFFPFFLNGKRLD